MSRCDNCGREFPSRSAVFRHLRDLNDTCLSNEEHSDMCQSQREKTVLLYGYFLGDGWTGEQVAEKLQEVVGGEKGKFNRSYGHTSRNTDIARQDEVCGAVSEVMSTWLSPLSTPVDEWVGSVNETLTQSTGGTTIRLLGRLPMPYSRFNAEMDPSHRKVEYLLPADFLLPPGADRQVFFESLPSFSFRSETKRQLAPDVAAFFHRLKQTMQSLTTQVEKLDENDPVAVLEKERSDQKRSRGKELRDDKNWAKKKGQSRPPSRKKAKKDRHVLKRRRYHNFTPSVMAHEFLAYRRLDRFFHRATFRFGDDGRPFLLLSMTGDLFLTGQAPRLVGLLIALMQGLVGHDFVDCLFDEQYPNLVPTVPAPSTGLYCLEAAYTSIEGKAKMILSPRQCKGFEQGWHDETTLRHHQQWEDTVRERCAAVWVNGGASNGRLSLEKKWTESVLLPWAGRARKQLEDYRAWKQNGSSIEPVLPPQKDVPTLFQTVLHWLRKVNDEGSWPVTTAKRQLVMVPSSETSSTTALAMSQVKTSVFHQLERPSAYDNSDNGGASGSFSVGAMPGDVAQPKNNQLFPELMKAAFELEIALMPDREPSSTIAINRNAQFRPHTDSGAGAGQSTSLIVGLGDYSGGELVVEGDKVDIRYKPMEFNGWKQRHWTMPFQGERFSLVWFTPKGCEGVHGIDLCG